MSYFNESQIETIITYAFAAGEIAEKSQKSGELHIVKKPDGSSVTSADIAISQFLNQKLTASFPDIPIICEEGDLREADDIFWLIDPIDGTSSYIKGHSQFAVNIALVKDKKVIFGLIYAPVFEGGKMVFSDHENRVVLQNKLSEKVILQPNKTLQDTLRIVASGRVKDDDIKNFMHQIYEKDASDYVVEKLSSAVKFFRILEDGADLYVHYRRSMEWDTASGQCLIELMGGKVKKVFSNENAFAIGETMSYKKDDFVNSPFMTSLKAELLKDA